MNLSPHLVCYPINDDKDLYNYLEKKCLFFFFFPINSVFCWNRINLSYALQTSGRLIGISPLLFQSSCVLPISSSGCSYPLHLGKSEILPRRTEKLITYLLIWRGVEYSGGVTVRSKAADEEKGPSGNWGKWRFDKNSRKRKRVTSFLFYRFDS